jgi:hypothetical protein
MSKNGSKKWDKMVKYRYSRIRQNKTVLNRFDFGVYKYTTRTHKTQYRQFLGH